MASPANPAFFGRMELRHLRSFLAVADHLSFSRAATALHITQPALSRQIRGLEHALGCRLFERRPTDIRLTAEGELLRERAGRLVRDADGLVREMQARAQRQPAELRLAHFGTFLALHLAPFLHRLHRRRPQWRIELIELSPADALRQLARGGVDAAVLGRPEPARLEGLQARTIWTQTPLIVVPADHPLAKRRSVKLRDLATEKLLVWDEAEFPGFGAPFLAACRDAGFEPQVVETVRDVAGAFTSVARDGRVSYVGRLAGQLAVPGVAFIPLAAGELDMPTLLVWRPESPGAAVLGELARGLAERAQ